MKKFIAALALASMSVPTLAAWSPVAPTRDGALYTSSDVVELAGEFNAVAIYAVPSEQCSTVIKFTILTDANPEWSKDTKNIPTTTEFKIDDIDRWVAEAFTTFKIVNKHAIMTINIPVSDVFLAEAMAGNTLLMRSMWDKDGEWLHTIRYPLAGSAQRIAELLQECQKAAAATEIDVWRTNKSENEWKL